MDYVKNRKYKLREKHYNIGVKCLTKLINNIKTENVDDIILLNKINGNNDIDSAKLYKIIKGKEKKIKVFYELITDLNTARNMYRVKLINLNTYMTKLDGIYMKLEDKLSSSFPQYANDMSYKSCMHAFKLEGDVMTDAFNSIYKYIVINDIINYIIKTNDNLIFN